MNRKQKMQSELAKAMERMKELEEQINNAYYDVKERDEKADLE